jgi:hypothetical protein
MLSVPAIALALLLSTFAPNSTILTAAVVASAAHTPPVGALVAAPDTAPLEFHGFRAGARLDELQALVQTLDGGRLRCDRAKKDRRVTECRGVVTVSDPGAPVDVWISAIDSVAGVITLSGAAGDGRLDRWRRTLERRYGRVDAKAQGSQWMMQWVRRGRMLRLTWRIEKGEKLASVSLVDGRVLDGWHPGKKAGSK